MNDRHRIQKLKKKLFGSAHRHGAYYSYRRLQKQDLFVLDLVDTTPIITNRSRQVFVALSLVAVLVSFMVLSLIAALAG